MLGASCFRDDGQPQAMLKEVVATPSNIRPQGLSIQCWDPVTWCHSNYCGVSLREGSCDDLGSVSVLDTHP